MYTTVSARLDSDIKAQAEQILSKLGLSHSAAISALYSQIVLQQGLPFASVFPSRTCRERKLLVGLPKQCVRR